MPDLRLRVSLAILTVLLFYWPCQGQMRPIQWSKTYGGVGSDGLSVVQPTPDGGYVLAGASDSPAGFTKSKPAYDESNDYWVVKIDARGRKQWDCVVGGPGDDDLRHCVVAADGGYFLGGRSSSGAGGDKSQAPQTTDDYWLVKLDAQGHKLWDRIVANRDTLSTLYIQSLRSTPDGGCVVGGGISIRNPASPDESPNDDYWVSKIDAQGATQWSRTLGGSGEESDFHFQVLADGGIMLGGTSTSGVSGDKTQPLSNLQDLWFVRLNNQGQTQWDRAIAGDTTGHYTHLEFLSTGGCVLISVDYNPVPKLPGREYRVSVLDADLRQQGQYTLRLQAGEELQQVKAGRNGSYVVRYSTPLVTKDTAFLATNRMVGLRQFDARGREQWKGTIPEQFSWQQGPDGRYVLSSNASVGGKAVYRSPWREEREQSPPCDYWVVRLLGHPRMATGPALARLTPLVRVPHPAPPRLMLAEDWNHSVGSKDQQGIDRQTVLALTPGGGYLLGGDADSGVGGDKTQPSRGGADYWLVKLNEQGEKLWDRTFGGDSTDLLTAVLPTRDAGYLLGGTSVSGIGGDKTQAGRGKQDFWVVKVDAQGRKQWDQTFGGSGDEVLAAIRQSRDGGYVLAGTSQSGIGGDKTQASRGDSDYWLLRLDAAGNKLWDRTLGGDSTDQLTDVEVTSDGGYLVAGTSVSSVSGEKSAASRGREDYWLIRLDAAGAPVWNRTYGTVAPERLGALRATRDDGYILAGSAQSAGRSRRGSGSYILKIDAKGNEQWSTIFEHSGLSYRRYRDQLTSIEVTPDNGYLLGGESYWETDGVAGTDYRVVRLDQWGNVKWTTDMRGTTSEGTGSTRLSGLKLAGRGIVFGGSFIDRSGSNGYSENFYLARYRLPAEPPKPPKVAGLTQTTE